MASQSLYKVYDKNGNQISSFGNEEVSLTPHILDQYKNGDYKVTQNDMNGNLISVVSGGGSGGDGGGGMSMPGQMSTQPGDASAANGSQAIQYDGQGRPIYPGITNLLGPDGKLKDQFQVKGPSLDTAALDALQSRALSAPGTSDYEKYALEKQRLDEGSSLDKAAKNAKTAQSGAYSALSTTGGLSAGARERIGRGANLAGMQAKSDITGQGVLARLGIASDADAKKTGILSQLPGMQTEKANYGLGIEKLNTGNALSEAQRQDLSKLGAYSEAMKGWAAEKTGQAQQSGGKK